MKTPMRNLTLILSLLFVGCGEKKEAITKPVADTIYFNPIINHSRIPNNIWK